MRRSPYLSGIAPTLLLAASILFPESAHAQPGNTDASEYHAVAPMPQVMRSPMPSLPPPIPKAPGEQTGLSFSGGKIVRGGFTAYVQNDGRVAFSDGGAGGQLVAGPMAGVFGRFDINASVMRWFGQDPYLSEKLDILDRTRDRRAIYKVEHDAEVMERALYDLPRYLQAVWDYTEWNPAQRKAILFALWDECAEIGAPHLIEAGARARLAIAQFIARKLPAGTPGAYSRAELRRLNAVRGSRQAFIPYDDSSAEIGTALAAGTSGSSTLRRAVAALRAF